MNQYLEQAIVLHKENPVVDAHLDLAAEVLLRYQNGEKEVIGNHYLKHFKEAGVNLIASSIYVETKDLPELGLKRAMQQISALMQDIKTVQDDIVLVKKADDLNYVLSENKTGILLYMEGLDAVDSDLELLDILYELGVRGASLTWSRRNKLGEGCCKASEDKDIRGGLTKAGREAVHRMEEKRMFLDISHLNDDGFKDVEKLASIPYIASHSNVRNVHRNYRNLTDRQIMALAKRGGVIGLNAYKDIVGCTSAENAIIQMCEHVEYILRLTGDNHIGYGFDLCDSMEEAMNPSKILKRNDCLRDYSEILLITAKLLECGYSHTTVKKIIGGNFINYFYQYL